MEILTGKPGLNTELKKVILIADTQSLYIVYDSYLYIFSVMGYGGALL